MAPSSFTHKPFEVIKGRLKGKKLPQAVDRVSVPARKSVAETHEQQDEEKLFREALKGVKPLEKEGGNRDVPEVHPVAACGASDDDQGMEQLARLVKSGTGFVVADTPEYMEGTGYHIHPAVLVPAGHRRDSRRATDGPQGVSLGQDDAELPFVPDGLGHEDPIAVLKDVQRER